jgi:putative addiction module component (TIGR02574 family)
MNPATERLLQSALSLPEDERLQLVEALLAECDRSLARPFDNAWLAEIERRSAQIDGGTAVLTPWPEVRRRVREKLEGRADGGRQLEP